MLRLILLAILALLIPTAAAEPPINVLAIGDELIGDSTFYLRDVAAGMGRRVVLRKLTVFEGGLRKHCEMAALHAADPEDPAGKYASGGQGLADVLDPAYVRWDFVVLQPAIGSDFNADAYRPWAEKLAAVVREKAPTARLMIHLNWTAQTEAPYVELVRQEVVEKACRRVAEDLRADFLPIGPALYGYQLSRTCLRLHGRSDRSYDRVQPHPSDDDRRLNETGRYLAALTFYAKLAGRDPRDCEFRPEHLSRHEAAVVRATARTALRVASEYRIVEVPIYDPVRDR